MTEIGIEELQAKVTAAQLEKTEQQRYWYQKMENNRLLLGLPELPFDPNRDYIPVDAR